ncbi:hypothetical protein NPIL_266491 [Nephila pilipes]|uniref:Uncharacterized protein n=1 Tax=Nephila pilipes TaxID=299642 RepID=A0A8X6P6R4_NEPPI|nr:hypothetical protein NPIL_266491 [Nephila pilipes]
MQVTQKYFLFHGALVQGAPQQPALRVCWFWRRESVAGRRGPLRCRAGGKCFAGLQQVMAGASNGRKAAAVRCGSLAKRQTTGKVRRSFFWFTKREMFTVQQYCELLHFPSKTRYFF